MSGGYFDWLDSPPGRRVILILLLVYGVVGLFSYSQREGDFAGYLLVGDLLLSGGDIYHEAPRVNTWPPFFSLVCAALALLAAPSLYLARGVWILLNYGAVLLTMAILARLVYGRTMTLRSDGPGLSLAAPELLVPLLLTGRWVLSNFEHLQINILVFALALGGLYLHSIARERAGGLALGLAIALKVMPVVFIPYLAYRQRWRASVYTLAAAAVFSLSPVLVFGWGRFWEYVASWREAVAVGWGIGGMNHSVYAMLDRAIGHGLVPLQTPPAFPLVESGEPVVRIASLVALGLVAAIALWRCRGGTELGSRASLAEWSMLFIVAVLFGPVSRLYYLVVLLLPYTLLFEVWRRDARSGALLVLRSAEQRGLRAVVLLSAAMGLLSSPELIGNGLADRLEMGSWITVSVLLLLGAVIWLRPRLAERA